MYIEVRPVKLLALLGLDPFPSLSFQGFRWDTATTNAVCDLDAVAIFFDDNVSKVGGE